MWPLIPCVIVAICFAFLTFAIYRHQSEDGIGTMLPMIMALLPLPILAFVGGIISFILVDERRT